MEISKELLEKWKLLIEATKNYYIDNIPTGLSDSAFDELELRAKEEDGFFVRDYVLDLYLTGEKVKNQYIEKIKKTKVTDSSMFEAIKNTTPNNGFAVLKYDGSSIAVYIDSHTGRPMRVVTVGNQNLDSWGVDQTKKLINFLPKKFPLGILAIQCEALIDLDRIPSNMDQDRARQKANGLINSKYCDEEVNNLLTLRAYRYYTDNSAEGISIKNANYRDVIRNFDVVYAEDGHILFSPADIFTVEELKENPSYCETYATITSTGRFLNDGWVLYDDGGNCLGALKYAGAGSETESLIKTTVKEIIWNNQVKKGKDSWSANVGVEPVYVKGSIIKKPSAGSVKKLVEKKISPGSVVSVILANSTIPAIGECFSEGNGDFNWPTCSCGYQMGTKDIYGSLLKCGNILCTERLDRMRQVISKYKNIHTELNLNEFLVIDRFKWEQTDISIDKLLKFVEDDNKDEYYDYLMSYMKTDLQKRNMNLVWLASYQVLREVFLCLSNDKE